MKQYIPIFLALCFLSISFALIISTFIAEYWIEVKVNSDRYGIWRACLGGTSRCSQWYSDGQDLLGYDLTGKSHFKSFSNKICINQTENLSFTDRFVAFQALECGYIAFTFILIVCILVNMMFFPKIIEAYVMNSIGLVLSSKNLTQIINKLGKKIF